MPCAVASSVRAAGTSAGMPNSVCWRWASYMGQAEKRTLQPMGSELDMGSPEPPPVWSPTSVTLGRVPIQAAKALAAL